MHFLHENPEFSQRETAFSAVSVHREAVTMKVLNSYTFIIERRRSSEYKSIKSVR